ncbi:MAG: DnaJ domain-containing protein [Chloroflexota bacterium]|nr:DnaJ domain-containing protein [Chloroflexota bacterium]
MKNYYEILGIDKNAKQDEIKSAFRKLAFEHHPDRNPGNEKQSEENFKEINEAYSIIGDERKRLEYDGFLNGRFDSSRFSNSSQGFAYTQEDIFRNAFTSGDVFEELNRMFAQAGLRFDDDFLNRVFFSRQGVHFQSFSGSQGTRYTHRPPGAHNTGPLFPNEPKPAVQKPNFAEKLLGKAAKNLGKYAVKKAFGINLDLPLRGDDTHQDLKLSSKEAATGCTKRIRYKRGKEKKTIEVTVPQGIVSGKIIRLKGLGQEGLEPGDLYLCIRVK